jgi:hypothetical protein
MAPKVISIQMERDSTGSDVIRCERMLERGMCECMCERKKEKLFFEKYLFWKVQKYLKRIEITVFKTLVFENISTY